jgi:hypothetical protein
MMQLLGKLEMKAQGLVNRAFIACECTKGPKRLKTSVWLALFFIGMVAISAL